MPDSKDFFSSQQTYYRYVPTDVCMSTISHCVDWFFLSLAYVATYVLAVYCIYLKNTLIVSSNLVFFKVPAYLAVTQI